MLFNADLCAPDSIHCYTCNVNSSHTLCSCMCLLHIYRFLHKLVLPDYICLHEVGLCNATFPPQYSKGLCFHANRFFHPNRRNCTLPHMWLVLGVDGSFVLKETVSSCVGLTVAIHIWSIAGEVHIYCGIYMLSTNFCICVCFSW